MMLFVLVGCFSPTEETRRREEETPRFRGGYTGGEFFSVNAESRSPRAAESAVKPLALARLPASCLQ
jgi:chloramphenicol 3-O-phosphotransferase